MSKQTFDNLLDPAEVFGELSDNDLFTKRSPEEIAATNVKVASAYKSLPEDGSETKSASAIRSANSNLIRRVLRENGYLRNIIPPTPVTEFDPSASHDEPRVIFVMEHDIVRPRSVPFGTPPVGATFRGHKFEVLFYEIQTPEFIKHVDEFMGYKGVDIRQITMDNMLRDMQTEEDGRFMSTVDRMVGALNSIGAADLVQHTAANSPINRQSYKNTLSHITDRKLNNGVFLVNLKTAHEFIGFDRNEGGGDLSERLLLQGLQALPKLDVMMVPHIVTIKSEFVPNFHLYQFTEPDYLGKFCTYQDVRVFVKRERDWIRQSALSKVGLTIANVKGVHLHEFEPS